MLEHRFHRAVFFLRDANRFVNCGGIHLVAGHNMVDTYGNKGLRWALGLLGFDANLIAGYLLALFPA